VNVTHVVTEAGLNVIPLKEELSFDLSNGQVGRRSYRLANTFGSPRDIGLMTPFLAGYALRKRDKGTIAQALSKVLEFSQHHALPPESVEAWVQVVLAFNRQSDAVYQAIESLADDKGKIPSDARIILIYNGRDITEFEAYRAYYNHYQNAGTGVRGNCIITGEESLLTESTKARMPFGRGVVLGPAISKTQQDAESWAWCQNTCAQMSAEAWRITAQMAATHFNEPLGLFSFDSKTRKKDWYWLRMWTRSGDWGLEAKVLDGVRRGISMKCPIEELYDRIKTCREHKEGRRDYVFLSLWRPRNSTYVTEGYAILLVSDFLDRCQNFLDRYHGAGLRHLITVCSFRPGTGRLSDLTAPNQGRATFNWFHYLFLEGGPTLTDARRVHDRAVFAISNRLYMSHLDRLSWEDIMRQQVRLDRDSFAYQLGVLVSELESLVFRVMKFKHNKKKAVQRAAVLTNRYLRMATVDPLQAVTQIRKSILDYIKMGKDIDFVGKNAQEQTDRIEHIWGEKPINNRFDFAEKAHVYLGYDRHTQDRFRRIAAIKAAKAAQAAQEGEEPLDLDEGSHYDGDEADLAPATT
jgi:hypothetical protein